MKPTLIFLGIKDWRSAMDQAEDLRLLNEGQFGSRPYRNATEPVFIEELHFAISRATRKPLVLTNYDSMACYDRIIPNLAMTVSQKFGVPPTVAKSNASTLEKAEFHLRTELGIASTGYHHEPEFPIYGMGQGSAKPFFLAYYSIAMTHSHTVQPIATLRIPFASN